MRTRTLHLLALSGGLFNALLAACGGRVIVDGVAGEGGEGGITQTSSVTTTSSAGSCGFPAPVGVLQDCGAAGSSGSGVPQDCSFLFCDQGNNFYQADCTGESCTCTFLSSDGQNASCSCTLGATCSLNGPSCCPFP